MSLFSETDWTIVDQACKQVEDKGVTVLVIDTTQVRKLEQGWLTRTSNWKKRATDDLVGPNRIRYTPDEGHTLERFLESGAAACAALDEDGPLFEDIFPHAVANP